MPVRIQRSRARGWRAPSGAIYVGRPTKWGNPYDVKRYGLELALAVFAETTKGFWDPSLVPAGPHRDQWLEWMYADHTAWIKRIGGRIYEAIHCELRGHDLMCWCPLPKLGEPDLCHAAILLEIANA